MRAIMVMSSTKRKVTMTKNTNKEQAPKGPTLRIKETGNKLYNFVMFSAESIGAFILFTSGNTTSLKVLAAVLVVDAAVHASRLIAVVK